MLSTYGRHRSVRAWVGTLLSMKTPTVQTHLLFIYYLKYCLDDTARLRRCIHGAVWDAREIQGGLNEWQTRMRQGGVTENGSEHSSTSLMSSPRLSSERDLFEPSLPEINVTVP